MSKKVGALIIDEDAKRFQINDYASPKKDSLLKKQFKAAAAITTFGISVAAEHGTKALINNVKNTWHSFDELIGYEVYVNNALITDSKGAAVVPIDGLLLGKSKSQTKVSVDQMSIILRFDNLSHPSEVIPLATSRIKPKELNDVLKMEEDTTGALDFIMRHRSNGAPNETDENCNS